MCLLAADPDRPVTDAVLAELLAVRSVFVILLPARSSVYMVDRRRALIGSAYFLLIGFGFMFVEIGLLQRFSVFLVHPVYAP